MKVERDYLGKRYTFIPASKEDEKFLDVFNKYIDELEEENKTLKECNKSQSEVINNVFIPQRERLEEENRKLKESLDIATKCSSKEEDGIIRLSKENKNLKLTLEQMENTCKDYLNDRDTLREENKKLEHKNGLQEKALIKLCLKNHYDSIIIEGEEVIDMSNYKVVEKQKPQEEKLF